MLIGFGYRSWISNSLPFVGSSVSPSRPAVLSPPMPDTIQIIATIDGVPYAKTVQVEKVTVMGAYWTMHDLLEDVRWYGDEHD